MGRVARGWAAGWGIGLGLCGALAAAAPAQAQEPVRPVDGSSPRRALRAFVAAARAGHWEQAAAQMDLSQLPPDQRSGPEAARLARRLEFVLEQLVAIDWERVSDRVEGDPQDGPGEDVVAELPLADDDPVPLALAWIPGENRWRIAARTVAGIPALWACHGAGWLGDRLPPQLYDWRFLEVEAWQWLALLVALGAAWILGAVLAAAGLFLLGRIARRTAATWDDRLTEALRAPARYLLALLLLPWLLDPLRLALPAQEAAVKLRSALLVVVGTWVATRLVGFFASVIEAGLSRGVEDEARVRGIRTQVSILRRVASVVVLVVASALVLVHFEAARNLGMSLLASAGIAGVVLGLAAQRSISTLLAGIQLSFTQPIRIGDTVIVEGEWGWIEEINLTYVVVKVWDLRRLVVPIGRFLETPFQNWTKVSPEIMGTVEVFADYACPVEQVRDELTRICQGNPLWDGKVCGLQVTGASERTVTLRALVSSSDAGQNWDLRCQVRERLVAYLQRLEGGRYLPRARVDVPAAAGAGS